MPIYHCQEAQHNKFWSYETSGRDATFRWGRIGGSSESMSKSFSSAGAMHSFIQKKISEKTGKGYKLVNEDIHSSEIKTAQSLGIENKIQRILWVSQKGNTLTQLNSYDPAQFVFVEVLNSWSKQVTRLLLARAATWEISDSISESGRSLTYSSKYLTNHSQFAEAVRSMLKGIAVKVAETLKTVKFAAGGTRKLFDDDEAEQKATAVAVEEIEIAGCDMQVISKFAAMGSRVLEL